MDAKSIQVKEWVNEYGDALYSWAYYKTHDRETAEDLVQETYISAFNSYENYNGSSSPKTWLFTILNNKIIDYYRKKAREENLFSRENNAWINASDDLFDEKDHWKKGEYITGSDNWLDNPDFNNILALCIKKLPENWSLIIQAKYILDKDSKEICKELNISTSNYWQVTHRAKLLLKKCIELNWIR